MIKITETSGRLIECQDADEANKVLDHLRIEDRRELEKSRTSFADVLSRFFLGDLMQAGYWNRENFWKFIDSVGEPQRQLLTQLVQRYKISDEEIRKDIGIKTNLELGGILSGISKQAGALNIPARAVFVIENESQSGETTKSYAVAIGFLKIAIEMNWPG
jgi:hypothetical protein